jgi:hypothetical protein
MSDVHSQIVLDDALQALYAHRPLAPNVVDRVHQDFLLMLNHFSLKHEGNNLGIDETKMIMDLLSKKDSKGAIKDEDINDEIEKMPGLQNDIKEAVKNILVSGQLLDMAKNAVTETMVLQLHSNVMNELLRRGFRVNTAKFRSMLVGTTHSGLSSLMCLL